MSPRIVILTGAGVSAESGIRTFRAADGLWEEHRIEDVAIGTSGNVYPAAGFVTEARAAGARTVEVNLEPSAVASAFDEVRIGRAGEQVPQWVEQLLAGS